MRKKISLYGLLIFGLLFVLNSCEDDDITQQVITPTNVTAAINALADGSGTVTITPAAENAISFLITFEEGASSVIKAGESATYTYAVGGSYTITIVAYGQGLGNATITQTVDVNVEADPNEPLFGSWVMANEAGSLGVGPAPGDVSFFAIDAAGLVQRACYFNDTYVFGDDGSFTNNLGDETWLEGWQSGMADACGAPVAPHDGSADATYSFDPTAGTLTISGAGAYLGLPKAVNGGELPNVDLPDSITYNVTLSDDGETMNVVIETAAGIYWNYKMVKGDGSDVVVDDGGDDGGMGTGELINGDFEAGADPWTVGVGSDPAPVVTVDGNTYYSVMVETAGDVFSVNLSQTGLNIVPGTNYVLQFDAWSDRDRSIIAGIGLSGGDFANSSVPVNLTMDMQTFTLNLNADGFGDANSRVLFDNGGEVGMVNIDNVSLTEGGDGSDTLGEGVGEDLVTVFTTLVWADEFNTDGAPDAANWDYDLGTGDNGWGNGEIQSYTSDATNVIVEGGNLKITARAEEATGEGVYYFDDFQLLDAGGVSQSVVEDFEGAAPAFTDFGGATTEVISNPDASGVNTSATVARTTKSLGSETFAASFFDVSPAIDVPANPTISVKTWSPIANAVVRLKIEDSNDGNNFAEVDATTSTSGAWEELTFDFSGAATFNYDRIVIFFDFGNPGTAAPAYSSARIKSEGLQEFTYGRVETRAKLPTGGGTWPAIWMLGADYQTNPWPGAGEMDIMEHVGNNQDVVLGSTHDPNNFGGNSRTGTVTVEGASDEFHIYEMEWTQDSIMFAVDGVVFHSVTNDGTLPFNKDFFFILNVAMGGSLGGDIDPAFTESTMEVDYIRMYQ
ncbi:family 16 glycosylhydrolase [Croceivirga thetidis]|uniref:Family 16 glycosylhydrolase n=1 Tax=Croceivirga thetidis TaxID=2721623 RepID=A0ABX1GTT9_9FLAO|nr:family 16 glycosylhydrolase [Croceivirga thetidis]